MSLQLPTILSPPTPCTPVLRSLCSPQSRSRSCRCPFPGRLPFWASPFPSRLANASGRIEFIIFLIIDWLFASGCSPPRLSATQLPSATDSQCFCPTGTSTPLLVRTLRRTRDVGHDAPPPNRPISGIRLSSWWLTFKKIGKPHGMLVLRIQKEHVRQEIRSLDSTPDHSGFGSCR